MTEQRISSNNSPRRSIKRLDFGIVRHSRPASRESLSARPAKPVAIRPAAPQSAVPISPRPTSLQPAPKPVTKPTPKPIAKPTPRPVQKPRGHFIDFAPPKPRHPAQPTKAPSTTEVLTPPTPAVAATKANDEPRDDVRKERVKETKRATVSHTAPRGFRMDFLRRPKRKAEPVVNDAVDDDIDIAVATSVATAASVTPTEHRHEKTSAALPPQTDLVDDFGMSDFGDDDIDAIEAEIEAAAAETNDFVKAPKPLFEDPLVKLSKAREHRESVARAAKADRMREEAFAEARAKAEAEERAAKRSPYSTLYSADRSPFLNSVNVEKRPLSATSGSAAFAASPTAAKPSAKSAKASTTKASKLFSSAKSALRPSAAKPAAAAKTSTASRMQRQLDADAKAIHRQTMMMSTPETKSHKPALAIAILLTVLLGAGVGAIIYLVFFQES